MSEIVLRLKSDRTPADITNTVKSIALHAGLSEETQEKIREMVRRIVVGFDPDQVILFGSYAKGSPGPDSDVDLLVVMDIEGSRRRRAAEIDVALADILLPKDVIVVSPGEIDRYRDVIGGIIHPALREGIVVYERAA